MTDSGQEPPETGRGAPELSGNNQAPGERKGRNRGRKRRSGRRPNGNGNGACVPVTASEADGSSRLTDTPRGPVSGQNNGTIAPATNAANEAGTGRKRNRRGRWRGAPADVSAAAHRSEDSEFQVKTDQGHEAKQTGSGGSDIATSAKGRKAARRRGRKRWQAGKAAKADTAKAPQKGRPVPTKPEHPGSQMQNGEASAGAARERMPVNGALGSNRPVTDRRSGRRRRSPVGPGGAPLYAALDLGTNNCRLLIARPEERGFRVIDAYSRIVRLGEGIDANRRLSDAAMDRAIDALANCHRKLAERGVGRSRLIATEACRAAENGDEFITRVQAETGLALEVVNRETEARLAVAGCASLVDHEADGVILFDIGGGSSEIVWLDLRNRCGARGYALTRFIRSWISLPVGVVNLAERHGGVHVTPDIFEKMVDDAADHLSAFSLADNLTEAIGSGRVHMLGTSGTVTTLAGVHLGLKRYDRRRVDGTWLEDGQVGRMIDQLRDMPYEARVENPCIGADRADLVLAGCAILEAIRRRWSCPRLRVADRGLREGILTELMAADGVWSRSRGARHARPGNR